MVLNITLPELAETKVAQLPPASLDTLKKLREDACSSSSFGFKLQSQQRFLRRVLSPDAPTQNLLLVHGTGVGKTCSAIQIAEEYIIRPEFQDKKVLVLANPSIQKNFKDQIFDVSRVNFEDGLLTSKQCTGRRYLDILQRGQRQPLKVSTREQQDILKSKASKLIDEFYEFQGYGEFANVLEKQKLKSTPNDVKTWIHATFDNRLVIVDEAHNLRETSETNVDAKFISENLKTIIQTANGITLVLLTATPMYDVYEEIFDYFNLFLWNARKQEPSKSIHAKSYFDKNGDFLNSETEKAFRSLCETYISFVKGENPFTFPFRLPPPELAKPKTEDINGKNITNPIKYLPLTESIMSPYQAEIVESLKYRAIINHNTICTFPEEEPFSKKEDQYFYKNVRFLSPELVGQYSSKFALITKILNESDGLVFVYSNLAEMGVQLFAMCLEEHGYSPASGNTILGDAPKGSKGKYALITSESSDSDINRILTRLRRKENKNGEDIRIVLASPKVSEGVDFRYVRQIHILDPWFNMSRIEQVIGRGMRVCSHSLLPFEEQNTTVYLHVCAYADKSKEALDEFIYRTVVEPKGIAIAKVKKVLMESAMDCELEQAANALPADWRNLEVPQIRNQDKKELHLPISAMSSPNFMDDTNLVCKTTKSEPEEHTRPLSSILDVKDEILDKVLEMILRKPIWKFEDVYSELKYEPELVSYILQNAVESHLALKDQYGRVGHLEAKNGLLSFTIHENETMQDKTLEEEHGTPIPLEVHTETTQVAQELPQDLPELNMEDYTWPSYASEFSKEVKEWYYVDHLPDDKKRNIVFTNPKYGSKTQNLFIFGPDDVYKNGEKITPINEEKDEYDGWVKALKDRFIAQKDLLFAGLKEQKLIFNLDEKSVPVKKVERTKGIGGRACGSYPVNVIDDFMRWLGGSFPEAAKNRTDKCIYLDMKVRDAILNKKEGLVWYTPEEWAVLSEDKKNLK